MSKRVREAIYNNVVKPKIERKFSDLTAQVIKTHYDESDNPDENNLNLVDVSLNNPINDGQTKFDRVPVIDNPSMGGVDGSKIKEGDFVIVSFQGGEATSPRVIGKAYKNLVERNQKMRCEKGLLESQTSHVIQ